LEGLIQHLFFKKYNLFISLFLVFIFLIILYGSVESYSYSRVTKDQETYTINQGDTINKIFNDVSLNFAEKAMIKLYLKFNNINIIQAGHYDLANKNWRTFIDNLSNGFIKEFLLQIPEGSNLYDIKNIIENSYLELDCPNFICLDKQFGFYEGTLMPDTYFYKFKSSLALILIQSQNDFFIYTRNLWINRNLKNPLKNLSQAIILASIVEKEAGNDLEKPIIAGVFLHRININMKLQADPTIIYGLMPDFNGNITKANINDKNNPYNTYQIMGLPPTPISTISKTSLEAVILGQPNEYLYFVAKGDGTHYFSKDYNEHLNSVKKYQLNKQ